MSSPQMTRMFGGFAAACASAGPHGGEHETEREKHQQSSLHSAFPLHLSDHGVYQIGDVYARSVVVIGTSGAILMLKRLASYAVQRGVGISITRA